MNKRTSNRTLKDIIKELPSPEVDTNDVKHLVLQLITEIGEDGPNYASKSKVKLEALRLLLDCVKSDDDTDYNDQLLDILGAKNDDKKSK